MGMALKIRTILLERNMAIKELSDKLGYKGLIAFLLKETAKRAEIRESFCSLK